MNREKKARLVRTAIMKLHATDSSSLSVNELRVVLALERVVARTPDELKESVPQALKRDLDNGFWFGDITVETLSQEEHGTLRFSCAFQIGDPPLKKEGIKKLSRLHFDLGFGDAVKSDLKHTIMPSLLLFEQPTTWRVYPAEYIFSEKLETLIRRGTANSRAKDVYDLNILFEKCDHAQTARAIRETFLNRQTTLPTSFASFAEDLDTQVLDAIKKKHPKKAPQLNLKRLFDASGIQIERHRGESAVRTIIQKLFGRGEK